MKPISDLPPCPTTYTHEGWAAWWCEVDKAHGRVLPASVRKAIARSREVSLAPEVDLDNEHLARCALQQLRLARDVEASLFSCITGTRTSGGRWTVYDEEERVRGKLMSFAASRGDHFRFAYVAAPQASGCPHTHYLVEGPMCPEFQDAVHRALRAGNAHAVPYVSGGRMAGYMSRHCDANSVWNAGVACPRGPECADRCVHEWGSPYFLNPGRYSITTLATETVTGNGRAEVQGPTLAFAWSVSVAAEAVAPPEEITKPSFEIQVDARRVREVIKMHRRAASTAAIIEQVSLGRGTYFKVRAVLRELHLLDGDARQVPTVDTIERALQPYRPRLRPQQVPKLAAYRGTIESMLSESESALTITNRLNVLYPEAGASRASVRRLIASIQGDRAAAAQRPARASILAFIDATTARGIVDSETGEVRNGFVFVMGTADAGCLFAAQSFDLSPSTWLDLHEAAFRALGGVPGRVHVTKDACAAARAYAPCARGTRVEALTYRDLATHYGFEIVTEEPSDPAGPRARDVVATFGTERSEQAVRAAIDAWVHRTRRSQSPLADLVPLSTLNYNRVIWKAAMVHPDGHVEFAHCMYSVPIEHLDRKVLLATTAATVRIVERGQTIAEHPRLRGHGLWSTNPQHVEGSPTLPQQHVARCLQLAASKLGPEVAALISRLRESDHLYRTLREMQKIVGHFKRVDPQHRSHVAQRVMATGTITYRSAKNLTRKPAGDRTATGTLQRTETQSLRISPPREQPYRDHVNASAGELNAGIAGT